MVIHPHCGGVDARVDDSLCVCTIDLDMSAHIRELAFNPDHPDRLDAELRVRARGVDGDRLVSMLRCVRGSGKQP